MEIAPLGVDSRLTVASAVILYAGPAASLFLASSLRTEPALQLIVFTGALFGLLSLFIPGLIALGMAGGVSSIATTAALAALFKGRAALVVIDTLLHDLVRFLFVALIVKAERFFRRNGQVLYHSNIRLLPLGAAAGFGFGFLRGLCVVASSASVAMNVDTTTTNAGFVRKAPSSLGIFVDLESCTSMPLLVQQAVGHLFAFFGDILWTLLFVPFVAGFMLGEENKAGMPQATSSSSSTAATATATAAKETTKTKPPPRKRDPRWYEPTATTRIQQLLFFVAALVTHFIFGCVSLVNTDLVDLASIGSDLVIHSSERGCGVSLTVQGMMVFIAGVAAWYLTVKVEKFPAELMQISPSYFSSANVAAGGGVAVDPTSPANPLATSATPAINTTKVDTIHNNSAEEVVTATNNNHQENNRSIGNNNNNNDDDDDDFAPNNKKPEDDGNAIGTDDL